MPIEEKFFENLKEKYLSLKNGKEAWEQEYEKVRTILNSVSVDIQSRYIIDSPINIGGTGIVVKVFDKNLGIPQALKCSRPVEGKEVLLTKIISSEIARLIESSHENIVSIFYRGEISIDNGTWPYYIMEYIEGAIDAYEFIQKHKPDFKQIIKIIQQCVTGLTFLHSNNTIHGDIKLENILIAPDIRAKITDLGSARLLTGESEQTILTFSRPFAHPDLIKLAYETYLSDPNRARAKIPRSDLRKSFDLYALGKNILRLLRNYDIADYKRIPLYQRQYLELMACRMLDGLNKDDELSLNLPRDAFREIKYLSIEEVLQDIKKITGEYSIHEVISELDHHFPRTIQISSPMASSFTQRIERMISLPAFRRLAGVSQLGFIVQIYPTATHSRLEHILGTFANVVRYCDSLWNDPINPLFKQIISEHDINVLLLASLCHDIGQYPLAHDFEEADSKIFSHKEIGIKLITSYSNVKVDEKYSLKELMKKDWGVDPEEVVALLTTNVTDLSKPLKYRLLHTIIDGPIDADKIDYLIRDSNNLNVPYGKSIDFERLLRCLTVIFKQQQMKTFISLGIHEKGKIPAEAVSFARYAMFGSVYWHHTSRSAKSMLHRAVWEALPEEKDRKSKEYRQLQEELMEEVLKQINVKEKNLLFTEQSLVEKGMPEAPQLEMADYQMLIWLYRRTSDSGKTLLRMICERKLFKRILVVSARKNPTLWENLIDLQNSRKYGWQVLKAFQKDVQNKLIEIIASLNEDERTSSILSREKTDEIVARDRNGEILFLVDIPLERKGSSTDLYFLSESRIYGPLKSSEDIVQMEDSILWTDFTKDFLKSVGKIRVFCHPDIIETCTACFTRIKIETTLEAAFQYVTT